MSLATLLVLADGRLPSGGHAHSGGLEAAVAAGRVRDVAGLGGFLLGRLRTTGMVAAAFAACACVRTGEWASLDAGLDARTPSPALRKASRAQGRALLRAGRAMWPTPAPTPRVAPAGPDPGATPTGSNPGATPTGSNPGATPTGPDPGATPTGSDPDSAPAGSMIGPDPDAAPRTMLAWPAIGRDPHHPVALGVLAAAAGLGPLEAAVAAAHGTVTGPASAAVRLLGLDPYAVHALLAGLAPECDRVAAEAAARTSDPIDALPAAGAPLLDLGAEIHATWEVRLFAS